MKNNSGLIPHHVKAVVLPDQIETVTKGGIHLTDKQKSDDAYKQIYGTLVAVGKNAFYDWDGDCPKVGDRVCIGSYTGRIVESRIDGKTYRLLEDRDIWTSITFGEKDG